MHAAESTANLRLYSQLPPSLVEPLLRRESQ
jgi:hypothetical protein